MTPLALVDFDEQPFRFTATAKLDADPLAVFAELGDMSLWFPLMRRSVWKTGATSGVGAEREVDVATFGKFRERMLAWDTGARVAFTMTGSTSPLMAAMGEDWRLSREDIYTRIDWIVVGKPTLLGRAATPALRAILRVIFMRGCGNLQKRAGTFKREHAKQPA
ncbi:MAG TPA: SRPBCC family protein [Kofleriaceae bacterium]|nr:SRPBCC family protein [Kofleriaceae bacterium]